MKSVTGVSMCVLLVLCGAFPAAAAQDWTGVGGKATIPAGETWTISTDDDVAAVAALTEIEFEDEASAAFYTASKALSLQAKLSGSGTFMTSGGAKITFSGDSHDFEGVIAVTNTPIIMASRYGLGSRKSRLFLSREATTGSTDFRVTATGADCVIDVPIVYDGQNFTFYPDSSSDTLIFSNDLISVKGAYDYRPHFKNTVRFRDGVFGTTKTDSNLFPGIDGAQVWFEDDVKVDVRGNIYYMTSSSGATHWKVKPENLSATVAELHPQVSSGPFVLEIADALKGTSSRWAPYMPTATPGGYLDLNGFDQEASAWGGADTATEAKGNFYIIRSETPAVVSYGAAATGSETLGVRFDGQAGLLVNGAKTVKLVNSASTSTGSLTVADTASLQLTWGSKWDGLVVSVEDEASLDCQSASSITKGRAVLTVGETAKLNIASDVTLVVAQATIGTTTLEQNRTYTVAELAGMGLGERVTGEGAIQVVEYVKPWEGWPTEPGQKAEVPSGTQVTVDVDDHAKALACREIYVQADAGVTFVNLPDDTVVTNAFSGRGTIRFVSANGLVMQGEASRLVTPGHIELATCDTVYVDTPTALGGEGSGSCYFISTDDAQRNLYFRGEGAITNRAAILFDGGMNFGPLAEPSTGTRLYQANSWQYNAPNGAYAYICNAVTFCGGTFGTVANNKTAFFCGKTAAADIVLTDEVDFKMANGAALFFYGAGTWHFGPKTATYGGNSDSAVRLGISGNFHFICMADDVLGVNTPVAFYVNSGSPSGELDLNGHDQTMPYFFDQSHAGMDQTKTENHGRIDSATPAKIVLTSQEGKTRAYDCLKFRGQAGLWLKGNDNLTLSRQQSTSLGELMVSGGSLTLNYSAAWAGTNIVVNGGTLIVDETAGGKYIPTSEVETPVLSRDAYLWITDGGKVALGTDVTVRSVMTGEGTCLEPGVWGSSAARAAGRIAADHVRDDLFDDTCAGVITVRRWGVKRGLVLLFR